MKSVEVWVTDIVILNISGDDETIRIKMPDGHSAWRVKDMLLLSEDVCEYEPTRRA